MRRCSGSGPEPHGSAGGKAGPGGGRAGGDGAAPDVRNGDLGPARVSGAFAALPVVEFASHRSVKIVLLLIGERRVFCFFFPPYVNFEQGSAAQR